MIRRVAMLLVALPMLAAAQGAPPSPSGPTSGAKPEIYLRSPANGATVAATFPVAFGLKNYGVAPAGVNVPMTGHFHIIVDAEAPAVGAVIPKDDMNLHFGTAIIETSITLKPGAHTLRVVLGDADHKVISKDLVSAPVKITVK